MEYVRLGRSGLNVSRICLGAMSFGSTEWRPWVLNERASRPLIKAALDAGINFFDTANMYSVGRSEEILGKALHDYAKRDEVVIATKVFFPMGEGPNDRGLSRKHIFDSIDASLQRLGTDYIDLYQIHRFDHETPIEETLDALDDVVRSGKVRYLGASSMYAWQFARMLFEQERNGWSRFVSMQNHYNLVYREEEREMNPLCLAEGVGLLPWSPLARGFLAGNRSADRGGETLRARTDDYAHGLYYESSDFEIVKRLADLAASRNIESVQLALAWLLSKPGVVAPIIGTTKPQHLESAVAALDVALDAEEVAALEELYVPHRILGHK